MTRFIFYLCVLLTSVVFAQEDENAKVKATINTFFEGFHKGDTILVKSVMMDKMLLQTTYTTKEGNHVLVSEESSKLMSAIANRPNDQKWDERLLTYNIQVDGLMAHVWTPYEFYMNCKLSHYGVNAFTLFKENEKWKIIYVIDTRRK